MTEDKKFSLEDAIAGASEITQLPTDEEMKKLSDLASLQLKIEKDIADTQEMLVTMQASLRRVSTVDIPDLMITLNMTGFELASGESISVGKHYTGSILKEDRDKAHVWLEENGHGDCVKVEVTTKYGMGEKSDAADLQEILVAQGLNVAAKESVHHSTLKALLKNMHEHDEEFPEKLFNFLVVRVAKIKLPKGKKGIS